MNDAARYLRTRIGAVVASFRDIARCRARNTAAAAQLKDIVDYSYSYYRLHSLDWAGLFEEHSASLLWADSPYAFARAAALLLGHARDPHISLKVDGETFLSFAPDVVPNYNLETLRRAAAEWSHPSPCVYVGRFGDGIGYVMIGTWSADRVLELEPAFEALNNFSQGGGLVVDVRSNGGGSEDVAKHFAGCFVREPVVYARHKLRDPCASSGFSTPWDRVLAPTRGRPHYGAQTAVLMGQATRSSSEAFLLMMRRVRGCVLVGETSYGSSGNPQPYALCNGVTVMLPCWQALLLDGTCFEGRGIQPDVHVPTTPLELPREDPILYRALALLKEILSNVVDGGVGAPFGLSVYAASRASTPSSNRTPRMTFAISS